MCLCFARLLPYLGGLSLTQRLIPRSFVFEVNEATDPASESLHPKDFEQNEAAIVVSSLLQEKFSMATAKATATIGVLAKSWQAYGTTSKHR